MTHRIWMRAALLTAAALLAAPAAAPALTYQAADTTALGAALTMAAATPDADTIELGPGTFTGPFEYASSSELAIVGAGQGQTTITTTSGYAALNMSGGTGDRVASLSVDIAGGATIRGIYLGQPSAIVEDVTVTRTGGTNVFAIQSVGVDATIRRTTVSGDVSRAIEVQGGDAQISDVVVSGIGSGTGIEVDSPTATATVRRARVSGAYTAAKATFTGTLTITDSLLDMRGTGGNALDAGDNNNSAVHKSAIAADRVTIIGDAMTSRAAVVSAGSANEGDVMSITLRDSIVSGITTPLACFESGTVPQAVITVADTAITGGTTNTCADGMLDPGITQTGIQAAAPGFVDAPGGDFRLRWDSPLLDLGATAPSATLTDLGGLARVVDGDGAGIATTDLGAFEYQRRPPVVDTATATPAAVKTGEAVAFAASASDADPLEGPQLSYAWAFDDGGTATGPAASHAFATGGSHVATLTVADPSGATAVQQLLVAVTAPAAPTPTPTPAPTATTKVPISAAKAIAFPTTKRCASRRSFRIRLRVPKGVKLKDATVTVRGRKAKVVKGSALTAPIDLRGLPKGSVRIGITLRTTDGRKVTGSRTYRTCTPKRR